MDLKEYIRKYQGKYFKSYNKDNIAYIKIIKVKETPEKIEKYNVICEYVYLYKNGVYDHFVYPTKANELIIPSHIGYNKITKTEYMNVLEKAQEYIETIFPIEQKYIISTLM